jgi:hypothetical protein
METFSEGKGEALESSCLKSERSSRTVTQDVPVRDALVQS